MASVEMELGNISGYTVGNPRRHFDAIFCRAEVEADATESRQLNTSPD
jgi:hypothetical protein